VIHYGNLHNGHYIAYGKRGDEWYEFNDEKVKIISIDDVLNDSDAYILMYQ